MRTIPKTMRAAAIDRFGPLEVLTIHELPVPEIDPNEVLIEHAVIPWCEKHGVAVVGYSPFGHGDFPGSRTKGGRVLEEIAAAHKATPRQVALRFLVRRSSLFTIPKASSPDHAAENAGAGELRLTETEIARIDEAFPRGPHPRRLPML